MFRVAFVVAAHHQQIGAEPQGGTNGHGRTDPKVAGFVTATRYDPAPATAADRQGAVTQFGVVQPFDGYKEGIEVEVDDRVLEAGSFHETNSFSD